MQRVDIFVLARQVHHSDTHLVNIRVLEHFFALLHSKVGIKDGNGKEVSPCRALEGCRYFNHPVDHFGPVFLANLVFVEGRWLDFVLGDQVLVDLSVEGEIEVFTLLWSRSFCAYAALGAFGSFD